MNFAILQILSCIIRIPVLWDLLRGSIGLMHGRYRSPTVRSKLAHHAICAGICQIWLETWPEPKFGATLV